VRPESTGGNPLNFPIPESHRFMRLGEGSRGHSYPFFRGLKGGSICQGIFPPSDEANKVRGDKMSGGITGWDGQGRNIPSLRKNRAENKSGNSGGGKKRDSRQVPHSDRQRRAKKR